MLCHWREHARPRDSGHDGRAGTYQRQCADTCALRLQRRSARSLASSERTASSSFFLANGELLVNEIAPRPHNSGHYTIDVTQCSQFEQQVRAVCDLPLVEPKMSSSAIMMNILGDGKGDHLAGEAELLSDPSIVLHMYGKHHAVDRRKMGHFTMLVDGPIDEPAIARAKAAHAKLGWED